MYYHEDCISMPEQDAARPYPYGYQGMGRMGQIIPPIKSSTVQNVIIGAVGLLAFSVGFYLLVNKRKKQHVLRSAK